MPINDAHIFFFFLQDIVYSISNNINFFACLCGKNFLNAILFEDILC